jgi:hypothetical protein
MKSLLGLTLAFAGARAFYLPGVAPTQYMPGAPVRALAARCACEDRCDHSPVRLLTPPPCRFITVSPLQVELQVNKLTSSKTHLGYEYYQLPFCRVRAAGWACASRGRACIRRR